MAYPKHPKGPAVDRMLLDFASVKEIRSHLRVGCEMVQQRAARLGMTKHWITREERELLNTRREVQRKLLAL